ncbi:MAG: HPr family phosphocarrier protein [Lachnospiraceae bacterium]
MVSKRVTVKNEEGLHMRPAGLVTREMTKFQSTVYFIFEDKKINAKSVMNLIAGGIKCGSEITIECEGEDENEALERAVNMIEKEL